MEHDSPTQTAGRSLPDADMARRRDRGDFEGLLAVVRGETD
jgi:hypothetical protein